MSALSTLAAALRLLVTGDYTSDMLAPLGDESSALVDQLLSARERLGW